MITDTSVRGLKPEIEGDHNIPVNAHAVHREDKDSVITGIVESTGTEKVLVPKEEQNISGVIPVVEIDGEEVDLDGATVVILTLELVEV